MNKPIANIAILLVFVVGLSGCCIFKKGSWDPLPSCENHAKNEKNDQEKGQMNDENDETEKNKN